MEILIIGLGLVALMVFVSTRIKKNSAKAFEREKIITDRYNFFKPEGYIIPVKRDSEFEMEAFSKEKGEDKAGNLNRSKAALRLYQTGDFDEICRTARARTANIISDETAREGDLNYYFMRGETSESGFDAEIYYKIIEDTKSGDIYQLEISILKDYLAEFSSKASAMLQSFSLN